MPLVRISLMQTTAHRAQEIGRCVYDAMRETIGIPEGDNFQVINHCGVGELVYDPTFLGIERTNEFMIIEITLGRGRETAVKQALFARITELLEARCQVRPDDVMIGLNEVGLDDMSLGQGRAQFVENPPARLLSLSDNGSS
ncbi:tautomerase family protein [Rhodococcus opacus]|uniref:tautomerase family protein n=1 Tax=Rhodococcus opacus TaxID=37919 RepID=UPI00155A611E|nr:tautomerase family protein [Rhodococcus opacus]